MNMESVKANLLETRHEERVERRLAAFALGASTFSLVGGIEVANSPMQHLIVAAITGLSFANSCNLVLSSLASSRTAAVLEGIVAEENMPAPQMTNPQTPSGT